ncbi:helix-turn-helix domain-containing protein [Oscillibacter sp.]|uniref:helix-turn-helix domain-containing protein n=1 Tax=Oscillibacter sp. TaxID=1945593 RepID=UPI001B3DC15A|nr:helix-turn-helix transcriptional regulator [Oscillibacter sp.]MBP3508774.1 helix-turn-helix transcriptional regulator [Oscillibacter sp.]
MYDVFAKLIEERGITPYRVYKETGVAQSTLSDWKNGKGTPSADKLKKIADFLNVSVDYLLTGKEKSDQMAGLNSVYFSIAKDAQDNGIDPADLQAIIDIVKRRKKEN